jgi:hypothetical protein
MIRVALFHNQSGAAGHIDLDSTPIAGPHSYRCIPEKILSFENVASLAQELAQGAVSGWIQGFRWYRQAKEPGKKPHPD